MGFRVILIENEVGMRVKLNNLIVEKEGKDIWIPIDDISMIVLDNLKINFTTRMLSILAEYNVGVVFCNQEHLPIGYYSSYDNHSRISKNIGYQIEKTKEYYDVLWKKIVINKIRNQAMVLELLCKSQQIVDKVKEFESEVTDGDPTNREAHAAKVYFNELMGKSFSRGDEDILINSGLDYGYSIVRSYMARLCVGYGLNSQLGIHHKNEYNRFNLVDDMIEPIRPILDIWVYRLLDGEKYFKPEHRKLIVDFLNHKIVYMSKKMYIANMLEKYVGGDDEI